MRQWTRWVSCGRRAGVLVVAGVDAELGMGTLLDVECVGTVGEVVAGGGGVG